MRTATLRVGLVSLLCACAQTTTYLGTFDTPAPIAVLDAANGPFTEPIGYAADSNGGRIRVLALARGRYLAEDPYASFDRGANLPTGASRLLAGVAGYAPDPAHAWVWAIDRGAQELLKVPHIVGRDPDGSPAEAVATVTDIALPAGGDVRIEGLRLDPDRATSEVWTLTWDGQAWQVQGTLAGPQPALFPDVGWAAVRGGLSLVVRGTAAVGDTITITVDRGVEVFPLDGRPLDLSMAPDQSTLLVLVQDEDGVATAHTVDPATGAIGTALALPAGASPSRISWSADSATLYLTDKALPVIHEVDVASSQVTDHALPWPALDVAPLDDDVGRLLYVAPLGVAGGNDVWLLDPATDTFVDVNLATAAVDPMHFLSPVRGLAALPEPYDLPSQDEDNPPRSRSVAVSLQEGMVVWMEERTGCLVPDRLGPRTQLRSATTVIADYEPDFPIDIPGTAYLSQTEDVTRHVNVNPCAGIAQPQTWELRFDGVVGAWQAIGTLSGTQDAWIYEDERYLSDEAEISLTMRTGTTPSQDGWGIQFNVLAGVLRGDGDNEGDRVREVDLDQPARPVVFYASPYGTRQPWTVVAAEASDLVVRIDPTTGAVDAVWD
ncbi:MAG: hypothetical protein H6733_08515 [Alphaproteobacteria bacterium]|nr:hypothetical protein [Alphaproteobacteria bacterium]